MGKAPAFQFYVKDWLSDPELQCVSASTKGIWIDALCYMWEAPERGKLTGTKEELGKLLRATNGDFSTFMEDLKNHKFCDIEYNENCDSVTPCHKKMTLINRRMVREEKAKDYHTLRQQRYREKKQSDARVTLPSSSSSPSSKNIILSDEDFLIKLKEKYTWIDFNQTMSKMDAWLLANPQRKKTRRFIVSWFNRIEKPMEIKNAKSW